MYPSPDNAYAAPAFHGAPRWTLIPAALAPISLVAAWLVAGLAQPANYDPIRQTISVLAGYAASDRWIMTIGLYGVSICQIVTAFGLSVVRRARVLLALGGVAGLGVAIFPQPMHGSGSAHMVFATLSVTLLALWPATLGSRGWSPRPLLLTRRGSVIVTAAFLGLLAWVFAAAHGGGALGVAERVDTAIANAWPLVVILAIRRASKQAVTAWPNLERESLFAVHAR